MSERDGFSTADWWTAPIFDGRCATPQDLENAAAVFALADTENGRPLPMNKPAPVIWYAGDDQFAALVVQAEAHETQDGELQFLGLLLSSGGTAVVFAEDLEFVDPTDPVWLSLVEAETEVWDEEKR